MMAGDLNGMNNITIRRGIYQSNQVKAIWSKIHMQVQGKDQEQLRIVVASSVAVFFELLGTGLLVYI